MSDDGDDRPRSEKSLGLLTARFVKLLQEAKDGVVDLKTAAEILDVRQKRRIYDITNVLEGIGLIVKNSKNIIQWKGHGGGPEEAEELARRTVEFQQELVELEQAELALDESCRIVQHSLKNFAETRQSVSLAYITHSDARNLACFREKTLLAFKAPSGTELTVPEPHTVDNKPHFSLRLRSDGRGPIDTLLLCDGAFDVDLLPSSSDSVREEAPAKRSRADAQSNGPAVRLSPPPGLGDYVYQMHRNEGIADLFQLQ